MPDLLGPSSLVDVAHRQYALRSVSYHLFFNSSAHNWRHAGHIFHQKCLDMYVQEQPSEEDEWPGTFADCPICREPINSGMFCTMSCQTSHSSDVHLAVDPALLDHALPKPLRQYFYPAIRRVYMTGMPVDPSADAAANMATDFEIQQLRAKLKSTEDMCHNAEGRVRELESMLRAEQAKGRELQREKAKMGEQLGRAMKEAERCKQIEREREVRTLFGLSGTGTSPNAGDAGPHPPGRAAVAPIQTRYVHHTHQHDDTASHGLCCIL